MRYKSTKEIKAFLRKVAPINPLLNCIPSASLAKDESEKAHISSGGMLFLHVDIETYCFAIPAETHSC